MIRPMSDLYPATLAREFSQMLFSSVSRQRPVFERQIGSAVSKVSNPLIVMKQDACTILKLTKEDRNETIPLNLMSRTSLEIDIGFARQGINLQRRSDVSCE